MKFDKMSIWTYSNIISLILSEPYYDMSDLFAYLYWRFYIALSLSWPCLFLPMNLPPLFRPIFYSAIFLTEWTSSKKLVLKRFWITLLWRPFRLEGGYKPLDMDIFLLLGSLLLIFFSVTANLNFLLTYNFLYWF